MTPTPAATRDPLGRRRFLTISGTALGAMWADPLRAVESVVRRPYAPPPGLRSGTGTPVRVTGAVRSGGRGLAGVRVSDGFDVVATAEDGTYELITTSGRAFVSLTVPSGHRIPTEGGGPARGYRALRSDAGGEAEAVFDLEADPEADGRHAFLVLADIQTEDAADMARYLGETVPDVRETLAGLPSADRFVVSNGDIMWDHLEMYAEYETAAQALGVPHFQVVGNHDLDRDALTDPASVRTFLERFGPRHYSFARGRVHYVVLDDVLWHGTGYIGYLDHDALTWLERDLAFVEPGGTVVVFAHIPPLGTLHARAGEGSPRPNGSITNREALYRILEPFDAHVISGHIHESEHGFDHGVHTHVAGAVCGAWWTADHCSDGTPNGYAVYTADGDGLRWRYKATGQPADHGMRLYPPGANALAPDAWTANVWDWDPAWTVRWFADGEPRGRMEQRLGADPMAGRAFLGNGRPDKRPWVEPYPTHHLFLAPAGAEERITVEATDRFGGVWLAEARRAP